VIFELVEDTMEQSETNNLSIIKNHIENQGTKEEKAYKQMRIIDFQ
jgi:hypothetical protein